MLIVIVFKYNYLLYSYLEWTVKMPLLKKLVKVGTGKFVLVPKAWLDFYKRESGQEITEVAVEIADNMLMISPVLNKKTQKGEQRKNGPR